MTGWLLRRSLARRMGVAFLAAQGAIVLALLAVAKPAMLEPTPEGHAGPEVAAHLAAAALTRDPAGALVLRTDGALAALVRRSPSLWIVADAPAERVALGTLPPAALATVGGLAPGLRDARVQLGDPADPRNLVAVLTMETAAGPVRLAVGGVDPAAVEWADWLAYAWGSDLWQALPLLGVLGVLALGAAVPFVLGALRPLVAAAAAIGPQALDRRIPPAAVPRELRGVAQAFNDALERLAAAFARQERLVADVAHELRTPVAVLGMQVEALPDRAPRRDLQRGLYRMERLVGQLLDRERLALADAPRTQVDLVALARQVVADAAPLAVAEGYEIALRAGARRVLVSADAASLERALGNLVGNALAHGGGRGLIEVRVGADGTLDVVDEGPGVAPDAAARIFEPFARERHDRDGCGLGLHLVREIMRAHGGEVVLLPAARGATFRLALPVAAAA